MTTILDTPVLTDLPPDLDPLELLPGRRIDLAGTLRRATPGVVVLAVTTQLVAASAGYRDFFPDSPWLPLTAGAAGLGALCGLALTRIRRRRWIAVAAALIVLIGFLDETLFAPTTVYRLPTIASLNAVGDALLHGVSRILTVVGPANGTADLLAVPVTAAFLGAFTAAALTRLNPPVLCEIPGVLVLVGAQLLTSGVHGFEWAPTTVFVVAGLTMLALRIPGKVHPSTAPAAPASVDATGTPGGRVGLLGALVVTVTGLAVGAAAIVTAAGGQPRFDPRTVIDEPITVHQTLNPLVDVRQQVDQGSTVPLVQITTGPDAPTLDRIRVAALDTYDGVQWTGTGTFHRVGSTLPAGPILDRTQRISIEVRVQGALSSSLLPTIGQPIRIAGPPVGFDAGSGLLAADPPAGTGFTYTLTADVPSISPDDLATATVDTAPDLERFTAVPDPDDPVAHELAALADQLTATASTPAAKLAALATYLRALPTGPDAAPGHSYAALARVLPNPPATVDRTVTQEQTVAAFVLMTRDIGLPARVATGFRLTASPDAPGRYEASPSTAQAWAEVAFTGVGWVPFDTTGPTPDQNTTPPVIHHPDDPGPPDPSTGPEQDPATSSTTADEGSDSPEDSHLLWIPAILGTLGVLVSSGIALAKRQRRRRRLGAADARAAILGMWREIVDRLEDLAVPLPANLTPTETGRWLTDRFNDEVADPVLVLAPLVDQARYCSAPPDNDAGDEARYLEAEFRALLDSRHSWLSRFRAGVNPRSLLRRRTPSRSRINRPNAATVGST